MQKIEVIATSHFTDTRIGSVSRKQRLLVPINVAEDLHSIGMVEYANPQAATARNNPPTGPLAAGGGELPASLPVVQALQPTIVRQYHAQAGQSSPSMTPTSEPDSLTSSTPAISNGGESMPRKRGRPSKASAGLKTIKPQENTASIA